MKLLGSVAAVTAAIQEDAAAEIERLDREHALARAAIERESTVPVVIPEANERLREVERRAAACQREDEWRWLREDLEDRERWMIEVVTRGRQQLNAVTDPDATRAWIDMLVTESAPELPPGDCVLVVSANTATVLERDWVNALSTRVGRRLSVETGAVAGGCLVRHADAHVTYDNSAAARERRSDAAWRALLGGIYQDAVRSGAEQPTVAGTVDGKATG